MAVDLHNRDLLLCAVNNKNQQQNWLSSFGTYDSKSELNSPVESERGSSETESSEEEGGDDYMAELTRQMTRDMFQDDDCFKKQPKLWVFTGSTQSTVRSPIGLSHDTPTEPSLEQFPPLTRVIGKLEKVKIDNGTHRAIIESASVNSQNPGLNPNQALSDGEIQAARFFRLKQEQVMRHEQSHQLNVSLNLQPQRQLKNFQRERSFNSNGSRKPQKGQWPALQQQHANNFDSGMRAVFLNGSSSTSSGTGVFLPRGTGNFNEPRCSTTVLIPERVLKVLEQHHLDVTSRSNSSRIPLQHAALIAGGNNNMYAQQEPQFPSPAMNHQEISLPGEWTY